MSFNLDTLPAVLRRYGIPFVEHPGWLYRGYAGQDMQACAGVLWHHTATPSARHYSTGLPTANVLINGHAGLAGPLSNLGLGRDGVVHLIATGVTNHAGTGRAHGIPVNMGNHYLIGIEMESSGVAPWDWTPAMLAAAPKLGAALELAYMQHLDPSLRLQLGHYEYSDAGKIDPAGWPGAMDGLRAQINAQIKAWTAAPAPIKKDWFDMATLEDLANALKRKDVLDAIADAVLNRKVDLIDQSGRTGNKTGTTSLSTKVSWMAHNDAQNLRAASDTLTLVKALDALPVELTDTQLAALVQALKTPSE